MLAEVNKFAAILARITRLKGEGRWPEIEEIVGVNLLG
jgi:hypothetical protein